MPDSGLWISAAHDGCPGQCCCGSRGGVLPILNKPGVRGAASLRSPPFAPRAAVLSIVDARTLEDAGLQTDLCVIGAGAAGIALAIELTRGGREVCLLESGDFAPDHDTQSLHDLASIGYPPRANYMSRARYFGGSCNLWAGRSMLLSEFDVAPRPWVPHSGWPISHAELARHYPRAAEMLRLPGRQWFTIGATRNG